MAVPDLQRLGINSHFDCLADQAANRSVRTKNLLYLGLFHVPRGDVYDQRKTVQVPV